MLLRCLQRIFSLHWFVSRWCSIVYSSWSPLYLLAQMHIHNAILPGICKDMVKKIHHKHNFFKSKTHVLSKLLPKNCFAYRHVVLSITRDYDYRCLQNKLVYNWTYRHYKTLTVSGCCDRHTNTRMIPDTRACEMRRHWKILCCLWHPEVILNNNTMHTIKSCRHFGFCFM